MNSLDHFLFTARRATRGGVALLLLVGFLSASACQRAAENVPVVEQKEDDASAKPAIAAEAEIHSPDPATAVMQFLEAYRVGDDALAMRMLTARAREELAKEYFHPNGMESTTAEFTVGQVNFVGANQESAHVTSSWSDYDDQDQLHSQELIVILRKEAANWRVAGIVLPDASGKSATVMNFENSAEMKHRWEELQSSPTRVGSLPQ